MKKGAKKKETTLNELGEMLTFVVERMATKDDLKKFASKDDVRVIINETVPKIIEKMVPPIIDEKLQPLIGELVSIRKELVDLRQRAQNNAGLTKEIDHAFARLARIEKHLGFKIVEVE